MLAFQRCLGFTLFLSPPASLGLWECLLSFQSIPFCKVSQSQQLWLMDKGPPTLTNGKEGTLDPQLDILEWSWNTGILEWVAIPFSRGCFQPLVGTVSLMSPALAGRFFTTSTSWEALTHNRHPQQECKVCAFSPSNGLLLSFSGSELCRL